HQRAAGHGARPYRNHQARRPGRARHRVRLPLRHRRRGAGQATACGRGGEAQHPPTLSCDPRRAPTAERQRARLRRPPRQDASVNTAMVAPPASWPTVCAPVTAGLPAKAETGGDEGAAVHAEAVFVPLRVALALEIESVEDIPARDLEADVAEI